MTMISFMLKKEKIACLHIDRKIGQAVDGQQLFSDIMYTVTIVSQNEI